jgi:hypothetical protein
MPVHCSAPYNDQFMSATVRWRLGTLALFIIATARIIATYPVFSLTIDEPYHVAAGMEWLDRGQYNYEFLHPPLSRVAVASGPYLLGQRSHGEQDLATEGARILFEAPNSELVLTAARLGILPFFWLAAFAVYRMGELWLDPPGAFVATFLFTFCPPVLAHAGLATTDMAATAGLALVCWAFFRLPDNPGLAPSATLACALAFALLTKFSVIFFLVSGLIASVLVYQIRFRRPLSHLRERARQAVAPMTISLAIAALLVWAGYRFSFGKWPWRFDWPMPAFEFFRGIMATVHRNTDAGLSFFAGSWQHGHLLFFPTALMIKTPLPVLILAVAGIAVLWRDRTRHAWVAIVMVLCVVAVSTSSRINLGLRHILPAFPFLSILAAAGFGRLSQGNAGKALTMVLLAWLAIDSGRTHPDYLSYFNPLAGPHPEKIIVDSDLDWGQDMKRLAARVEELGITQLTLEAFPDPRFVRLPPHLSIRPFDPLTPHPGWTAVSLSATSRLRGRMVPRGAPTWLDRFQPVERVGKGMLLYHVPENSPQGLRR